MKVKRKSKKKKKASSGFAPRQIGVKTIATKDLFPNPHNPRVLFDHFPLKVLRSSIEKVGILVPLTIYFDTHKNRSVILDGQRRWICAAELKLATVPVNEVAEPTLVQKGAISPFDEKPGEASVFPAFVGLVAGSIEIGLTKKRRLVQEYADLSDHANTYSGKDASMQDRNLFSLFW